MADSTEKEPRVMDVKLRTGKPEDAEACGTICYEAFRAISEAHSFPPDFPSPEAAIGLLSFMLGHPGFHAIVAEQDGRVLGSNFVDARNPIAGIGPITVDPKAQNNGLGRRLMEAAHHYVAEKRFPGVRLVQAAFHRRSLSLYAKLGYDVREPLACMQGPALSAAATSGLVRPATSADIEACSRLCRKVHGHDRAGELRDAIKEGTATVVERDGRIGGYATTIGFFGHAVGETNRDLQALIVGAKSFAGPGFLLPTRNTELFRWCLARGLRVIHPMTLMSQGLYNEPAGAFLPSVLY
jgi:predicted N-acetyltransferase YhbS